MAINNFVQYPWLGLIFLIIYVLAILIYKIIIKKRKLKSREFSKVQELKLAFGDSSGLNKFNLVLSFVILFLLMAGLTHITIPIAEKESAINLVFVLDTSGKSLYKETQQTTRLDISKEFIKKFLIQSDSEDNFGIISSEMPPKISSCLNSEKKILIDLLTDIEANASSSYTLLGILEAIDLSSSIPNKKNVVVVLSDGVKDPSQEEISIIIEFAKEKEVNIYTIQISPNKIRYYLQDEDGYRVPEDLQLDIDSLEKIATSTNGKFYPNITSETLVSVTKDINKDIERETKSIDTSPALFWAALILFIIKLVIQYGHKRIIH